MNKKTMKVLVAFAAGQVLQLVIHAVALNLWSYRQIPFCAAGGFLVMFALLCGVVLSDSERGKAEHEKTYLEWAEVPGKNEKVVDPFKTVREAVKDAKKAGIVEAEGDPELAAGKTAGGIKSGLSA